MICEDSVVFGLRRSPMSDAGDNWLAGLPMSQSSNDNNADSCDFPGLAPAVPAAGAAY